MTTARSLAICALFAAVCGCAAVKTASMVSPALAAADPRVAVLPFDNQSTDIGAADIMRRLTAENIAKRGYTFLPLEEVDDKMSGLGISDGGQLPGLEPKQIGAAVGADLLCYGDVEEFLFQNLGFVVRKQVALHIRFVSASTGELLYEATGIGRDLKVHLDKEDAKKAFVEQTAVKLVQNILKSPLKQEAQEAARKALENLPKR